MPRFTDSSRDRITNARPSFITLAFDILPRKSNLYLINAVDSIGRCNTI